jgi:hypothetical protein
MAKTEYDFVIGMSEKDATQNLIKMGFRVRIRSRDNKSFISTMELRSDRINLTIVNDKVIAASKG